MKHDEYCQGNGLGCGEYFCDEPCICDLLAKARADEREQAAQRVAAYADMEGIGLKSWDAAIAAARGEDTK